RAGLGYQPEITRGEASNLIATSGILSRRFGLEKYRGKASRHTCPTCNHKHTFTRYVNESGEYLADDVGRCDRESKCGYHHTPKEHFADNPATSGLLVVPKRKPLPKVEKGEKDDAPVVWTIAPSVLRDSLTDYGRNDFVQFLLQEFDAEAVNQAVERYLIGTDRGRVIFWQVDERGRIRTGKIIAYDPQSGKRRKDMGGDWVHAKIKRSGKLPDDFELRQCLFGQHLLKNDDGAPVAIVEAEKTAVIASLVIPDLLWLACGGKTQLSAERLQFIRNRRVILFPDGDAFERWQSVANEARAKGGDVHVSDLIEQGGTESEKIIGFDLADYLIADFQKSNRRNPAFHLLLSTLGTEAHYALEERASVLEFDGGLSRAESEEAATNEYRLLGLIEDSKSFPQ
ncbi:MAG: DUF6371 domain-containing protein, partial [Blastocatellia bacterium]